MVVMVAMMSAVGFLRTGLVLKRRFDVGLELREIALLWKLSLIVLCVSLGELRAEDPAWKKKRR